MIKVVSLSVALVFMATSFAAAANPSVFTISRKELKYSLAESLAASREFEKAEKICAEALAVEPDDLEFKTLLADIYASEHKYSESVALYDQVLSKKKDVHLWVKKARILGWEGRYEESLAEYGMILKESHDPLIEHEMQAKQFYWNHWVLRGIDAHEQLVRQDPKNNDALFNLTQIYANERLWADAMRTFELLREKDPSDPRAAEGLEKVCDLSERTSWNSAYEFFEADSVGRDVDIRRHSVSNEFLLPLRSDLQVGLGHRFTDRFFRDHESVDENRFSTSVDYHCGPDLWLKGDFAYDEAGSDFPSLETFGAAGGTRLWDLAALSLSFDREQLENSSEVLLKGLYADCYLGRLDWDLTQRVRLGTDYLYARYSDDNFKHEPGADVRYYISYEPNRLYLKYRIFYRDFNRVVPDYFSPSHFWVNQWGIDWRYYIGTNDVYFGGKERYFSLAYDVFLDSQNIVSHRFAGQFRWEIVQSLTVGVEAFFSHASANVYEDKGMTVSLDYTF